VFSLLNGEYCNNIMSLYGSYIKERLNKDILEDDKGFATFYFVNGGVYIEDLYTLPQYRQTGHAARLADKIALIAKEQGYNKMFGTIVPTAQGSTEGMKVLLAYGFKLRDAQNGFITLEKAI
jgi:GNAT superfamily N-acetyltransferase